MDVLTGLLCVFTLEKVPWNKSYSTLKHNQTRPTYHGAFDSVSALFRRLRRLNSESRPDHPGLLAQITVQI